MNNEEILVKNKVGRPRIYTNVPDCENRNRLVNEMYKQKRYHEDPEVRQKKAERNKRNYEARKLKKEELKNEINLKGA